MWLRATPAFGKKSSSVKNSEASDHSSSSQSISKSPLNKMTSHVSPESEVPSKRDLIVHDVLSPLCLQGKKSGASVVEGSEEDYTLSKKQYPPSSSPVAMELLSSTSNENPRPQKIHWKRLARKSGKLVIEDKSSGNEVIGQKHQVEDLSFMSCADGSPSKLARVGNSSLKSKAVVAVQPR